MKKVNWKYPPETPEDGTYVIAQYHTEPDPLPIILRYMNELWYDAYSSTNAPIRWVALPPKYLYGKGKEE